MDDEFYEDADFLPDVDADEAAFYDGPTGEEGKLYDQIGISSDQLLGKLGQMFGPLDDEPAPPPAPEPVWDKPLLTPEEFMAKYGLKG